MSINESDRTAFWERTYETMWEHLRNDTQPEYSDAIDWVKTRRAQLQGKVWDAENSIQLISSNHSDAFQFEKSLAAQISKNLIAQSEISARYFYILKESCATSLARNEKLPTDISNWLSEYLRGNKCVPSKSKQTGKLERNYLIHMFVGELVNFGMNRSRNSDGTNPTSACDAVAEVFGLSFEVVKNICFKRPDALV